MQKLNVIVSRMALAAAVAALPLAAMGQGGSKPSALLAAINSNTPQSRRTHATGVSMADKKFVREAAQGGMAEVELGKLAAEKAASEEVRKFGQRMVDDHSKAGDTLKEIAKSKGIQVPSKLSAKDEMTKERLSKLSGAQFDQAYMTDMVKDHTQDVADFKRESSAGTDPQVKDFAARTLPTLKDHLRQAKEIAPVRTASSSKTMRHEQ